MAVVKPLKRVGSDLRVMSAAEVTNIIDEIIRIYGNDPGVSLEVTDDSPDGSLFEFKLGTLIDRRLRASTAISRSSGAYSNPSGLTSVPTYNAVNYIRVLTELNWRSSFPYKDRSGSTYANHSYPLFYDEDNNYIKAMSWIDIRDTFIQPAIERLVSSTTVPADNAGTYFVSTSLSESDATLMSSTPIAIDTTEDINAFSVGDLPEALDQVNVVSQTEFYLHRVNAVSHVDFNLPVVSWSIDDHIKTIDRDVFRDMLKDLIKYWSVDPANVWDKAIRYQFGTSSYLSGFDFNTRGTGITDTYVLNYIERQDQNAPDPNASIYYAQNVPTGTPSIESTNFLGIGNT